jgi:hypothetical protein
MGGFDYGDGPGDGTNWSSEKGETPNPGGGSLGNVGDGNQGNGNNSSTVTMVSSGIPGVLAYTEGFLSFEIGVANLSKLASTPLAAAFGAAFARVFTTLAAVWPSPIAREDMLVTRMPQLQITQTLPAREIITVDLSALASLKEAPVKARLTDVIDNGRQVLAFTRDKAIQTKAPVVEARATGKPRQFDVSLPGLSTPLRLDVALPSAPQPKPNADPDSKTFEKVTDQSAKTLYDGMLGGNTHDAIVTFPKALGMDPVYIAITRLLSEVELRQREEKQAQEVLNQRQAVREQAEQDLNRAEMLGAAAVTQYEHRKVIAEARLAEKQQQLAVMQARVVRLDTQARSARTFAGLMGSLHNQERNDANARAVAFEKEAAAGRVQINGLQKEVNTLSGQVKNATAELAQQIAAKAKAEAEAKAAAAKFAELMAKVGIKPTPVFTPEMVKSAQASLAAAGGRVLNRASGMLQLSTVAEGVLTTPSDLAGSISGAVWRGTTALANVATTGAAGATVGALAVGFWPRIDKALDKNTIQLFAVQASLMAAGKVGITPEMTSVNLPVRGMLVVEDGRQYVNLVKTGVAGVSANVPVLRSVRDEKTGLDRITLPAVAWVPSRTILINPVPVGPAAPPHTGNSAPVPVTLVHTGTEIKQVASIVTTTFPANDLQGLQDFIYWQLDAPGSGVEPIYVMLSAPPKSVTHGYKHYPPKGVPWADIVKTTANKGKAKFKPDVNIPEIDKDVWNTGQTTKIHPDWKIKQYDRIIGAYQGKETQWAVVKESQGVIHSHPISEGKAKEYMK